MILRLAGSYRLPVYLLLGSDAIHYATQAEAVSAANAERWREISVSSGVSAQGALLCSSEIGE
ncbi:MAG: hypothetical protein WA738_10390 [Candidatus Angelobacter sp.]